MDKDEDNFRVYDENCTSEIQERVKKTYYEMHTNQTLEFVQKKVGKKRRLKFFFLTAWREQFLTRKFKDLRKKATFILASKFKYLEKKLDTYDKLNILGAKIQMFAH